jgi:hypothetical protein
MLSSAGLELVELRHTTAPSARTAERLVDGLRREREPLGREVGEQAVDDLAATLSTLADLLGSRRLQEAAVVAQRRTNRA